MTSLFKKIHTENLHMCFSQGSPFREQQGIPAIKKNHLFKIDMSLFQHNDE